MSDQEISPCVMCEQHHEQMLMLTCMHDPCINCASVHYCSTQPNSSQVYICAKCGEYTELDSSSVIELQRVYHGLKGKKKYEYRKNAGGFGGSTSSHINPQQSKVSSSQYPSHNDSYEKPRYAAKKVDSQPNEQYEPATYTSSVSQPYTPISQPSYPTNNSYNISSKKAGSPTYMCDSHPEEQLSYFCFDCNCPICPECAIHGSHREHEVQTTRKAIKTIKSNLQQKSDIVVQHSQQVMSVRDSYKNKLRDLGEENKKDLQSVKDQFNSLRVILAEKQRQFEKTLIGFYDANASIVKQEIGDCERTLQQHGHVKKNIDTTMRKDDLSILQDYSKRDKEAGTAIEASKSKRYNDNIEGMKEADYGLFKDEMDQLAGIMHGLRLSTRAPKKDQRQ